MLAAYMEMDAVFPAPAGMNRYTAPACRRRGSVPRASGDEPIDPSVVLATRACSPRQRG